MQTEAGSAGQRRKLRGLGAIKNRVRGRTILEREMKGQNLDVTGGACLGNVYLDCTLYDST